MYTYMEGGGRGGLNSLEGRYLQTVSYAKSTVE